MYKFKRFIIWGLAGILLLAGCSAPGTEPVKMTQTAQVQAADTPVLPVAPTDLPTSTATVTPTSAPGQAAAYFLPDDVFAAQTVPAWQAAVEAQGLLWSQRSAFGAADLNPDLRLVLVFAGVLPPDVDLGQLAAASPQTQFIAFDMPGILPAENLTVVGPLRYDQQGFLAGAVAAMLTFDWRVGVISTSDTVSGRAARSGFLNGAAYFCGLCNPKYGPIVDYPLYIELPADSDSAQWQAAATQLISQAVKTVYLAPGVTDPEMLNLLAASQVAIITGQTVPAGGEKYHLASILPDQQAALALLPQILSGESGGQVPLSLTLAEIGPQFSEGRQRLAVQMLADLQTDLIDPGVDLQTGEKR